jgi:hypothetical protein
MTKINNNMRSTVFNEIQLWKKEYMHVFAQTIDYM